MVGVAMFLIAREGSAEPRMTLVERTLGGLHFPLLEQKTG